MVSPINNIDKLISKCESQVRISSLKKKLSKRMGNKRVTLCTTQVDVFTTQSCPKDMEKKTGEAVIRSEHLSNNHSLPLTEDQIKQALHLSIAKMMPKLSSLFCIPSSIFQRQKKKGFDVKSFSSKSAFHVRTYLRNDCFQLTLRLTIQICINSTNWSLSSRHVS